MALKYHQDGTKPSQNGYWVFVFGSNLSGIHGAGAAKEAYLNWGACLKQGIGIYGNSYAIPTKDLNIETLELVEIEKHVKDFLECAADHLGSKFFVTRVGCGLAGYKDENIAPMFVGATDNCNFPQEWKQYLES